MFPFFEIWYISLHLKNFAGTFTCIKEHVMEMIKVLIVCLYSNESVQIHKKRIKKIQLSDYITHRIYIHMYSTTCPIRHLCNMFQCVIRHWFSFALNHFLCVFFLCNPTPCLFRYKKNSLPVHVGLDRIYCTNLQGAVEGNRTEAKISCLWL